jgi:hypothetical protein
VLLEASGPYELGWPPPLQAGTLYPAYFRGQAYLLAHNGAAAAAEFQKLLDHKGIVANFVAGASGPAPDRARLCDARRHRQGTLGLPKLPHPLERGRPWHSHPERSPGGVRQARRAHALSALANRYRLRRTETARKDLAAAGAARRELAAIIAKSQEPGDQGIELDARAQRAWCSAYCSALYSFGAFLER